MGAIKVVAAIAMVALTMTACGGKLSQKRGAASATALPWWVGTPDVWFGYITSLKPLSPGYKLRFDLHLRFGPDKTGLQACIDNDYCRPGQTGFLDDTYDHDLKYVLTFYLPPSAPVQVVGKQSDSVSMTAHELYDLAHGSNPRHISTMATGRDILDAFGFYIEVGTASGPHNGFETVRRLSQVYHP